MGQDQKQGCSAMVDDGGNDAYHCVCCVTHKDKASAPEVGTPHDTLQASIPLDSTLLTASAD
jgi:hypothetical protein